MSSSDGDGDGDGGMKGNNGKAARRKLSSRLSTVLKVFSVLICIIYLCRGGGKGRHSRRRSSSKSNIGNILDSRLRGHHSPHSGHHSGGGDTAEMDMAGMDTTGLSARLEKLLQKDHLTSTEEWELIKAAAVHPVEFSSDKLVHFCRLNWQEHKQHTASVAMNRDLINKSPHCNKGNRIKRPLDDIIDDLRKYDDEVALKNEHLSSFVPHAIPPTGFVFHESRCGSTLVANSLAVVNPDMNRVYSESHPALAALTYCGEGLTRCSLEEAAKVLQDVVYLMGRTDDASESRLFFKIQSVGVKSIEVMREAFPDTPWIYVYRDPVQVMMSHIGQGNPKHAVCTRALSRPPKMLKDLVRKSNKKLSDLSTEEFCAAHLATLCQSALDQYSLDPKLGRTVNYRDLPGSLIDTVFPSHFGIPVGPEEEERINDVCSVYSKGGHKSTANKEWQPDSEKKENLATEEIRDAARIWLSKSYDAFEDK